MKALILVEHDQQRIKSATRHAISAASELTGEIHLLIMGYPCTTIVEQAKQLTGVKKIWLAEHICYQHQLAENVAPVCVEIAKQYDYFLATATTYAKNILPRVAALLDVSMLSDVVKIIAADTFVRPLYAGNILAKIQTQEKIKIFTIRGTAYPVCAQQNENEVLIEKIDLIIENKLSQFSEQVLTKTSRPELTAARIIISGGRGLKSAENFKLLEQIADQLGAAIGASRAAVDAGFAPNDYQVGQTGKVVAPDLYIAVGISGAIQHLAGMKDSKVVVAINQDPDAPIFAAADYGLVGDLFKILPELQLALNRSP